MSSRESRAKAIELVKSHIEAYNRWGQMSVSKDPQMTQLVAALSAAGEELFSDEAAMTAEEILKIKRQLTASLAREARQKKQIDSLKLDVAKRSIPTRDSEVIVAGRSDE